jgi:hypothetical protein
MNRKIKIGANTAREMPYAALPSLPRLLARAMFSRKPGLADAMPLKRIERTVTGAVIPPGLLASYLRLCGFMPSTEIPLPFFYVLAQRIQLLLLTDPAFPLAIPGIVHVRNLFRRQAPIAPAETLDLRCSIDGGTIVPAGREFEIVTEFFVNGRMAVESRGRHLSRSRVRAAQKKLKAPSPPLEGEHTPLSLPANAGRRYARVSGDWNPIHLHALTAKPFGFRRPIAQGIYLLSLAAARLGQRSSSAGNELAVDFKLPVFLPAGVDLVCGPDAGGVSLFELRSRDGEKVHLKGSFTTQLDG